MALDQALNYFNHDWGVLAVYRPVPSATSAEAAACSCQAGDACQSPGKHPVGGSKAVLSLSEIQGLDWPRYNIGLTPVGAKGGPPAFLVVDLDGQEGLDAWADNFGPLPDTMIVSTGGGGVHIYYTHPQAPLTNRVRLLPGVDIRAAGGFVVAPPSVHASGGIYTLERGGPGDLISAPSSLLDMLQQSDDHTVAPEAALAAVEAVPLVDRLASAERYLQKVPAAVAGNGGNQQTLQAWGVPYRFGITIEEAAPMMSRYNRRCKPPWAPAEFETLARNAYTYTDRPFGWKVAEGLDRKRDALADPSTDPSTDVAESEEKAHVFTRGDAPDLARWLMAKYNGPEHIRSVENGFFIYDPATGVWSEYSNKALRGEIQELENSGAMVLTDDGEWKRLTLPENKINSAISWLWCTKDIVDHNFLIAPPLGAVFKDGFACVRSDGSIGLEAHSPDHRATACFPFPLDNDEGRAADWLAFMGELFAGDADGGQKIDALQEFVGASILGVAPQYARCMMLTGEGKNGKSTFIQIIEDLFPEQMRAAISPKNWGEEYYRAKLLGVRLNAVSELPEKLLASDEFKQMITGETITGRNVKEKPFNFTPQAGHIFSVNTLPATFDTSEGFWRRFLVVSFNRNFERNPTIGGLRTKEEVARAFSDSRGAIALWALAGAARLVAARNYTMPASHHERLEEWKFAADAVADFVRSCCTSDSSGSLKELYKAFNIWAQSEGRNSLSKRKFSARLATTTGVDKLTRTKDGHRFSVSVKPMPEWADYAGPRLVGRL